MLCTTAINAMRPNNDYNQINNRKGQRFKRCEETRFPAVAATRTALAHLHQLAECVVEAGVRKNATVNVNSIPSGYNGTSLRKQSEWPAADATEA